MGDEGDYWRDVKPIMLEASKKKRASNREHAQHELLRRGIPFEAKNNDAHLIVQGETSLIDFWPGTGKYIVRADGKTGRGIRHVIKLCREKK